MIIGCGRNRILYFSCISFACALKGIKGAAFGPASFDFDFASMHYVNHITTIIREHWLVQIYSCQDFGLGNV